MTGHFVLTGPEISNGSRNNAMNKPYVLMTWVVLLIAAHPILAQHQHGGGSSGRSAPSAGGGAVPDYSSAIVDFQKAIVLQATEKQSAQLCSWTQRTVALDRRIDDIRQISESRNSSGLSTEIEALEAALTADNLDRHEFLVSLSSAQHSGLQKPLRRLERIDDAIAKALSEITQSSGEKQNTKLLAKGLQRAKKAIEIEQSEQQRLVREMGVTA